MNPMIYAYEDNLVVLSYDVTDEGKFYKITHINIHTKEVEELYQSENKIACASESESGIWFAEETLQGEQVLYQYDRKTQMVKEYANLDKPIVFLAENRGSFYLSERGDLRENLGGIYEKQENEFVLTAWIPFVAENNIIWEGKQLGERLIWKVQDNGYIFDTDTETLWMLDFVKDEESKRIRDMEDNGFSGIVQRSDGYYYVKYFIPLK